MKRIFWSLILLLTIFSAYSQTSYVYHDEKDTIALPETVIYGSLRATNNTPFSFTNVTKQSLTIMPGAEAAYALSSTPSITFYSDNGSTLGYVYYRLRGIDQTRLNVTLNGVPLNEPEDQGSYFNNFPNFLSGIDDVQIIRGAGLSKVGTSTFGGSLNFESRHDYNKNSRVEASVSYGSNNTKMLSAIVNANTFFIGVNKFSTDGYKHNSDNDSWSTNYGADFKLFKQKAKLFGIIGKQENGMAWTGETLDQIYLDKRTNTNKLGERDNFLNTHNQLSFEHNIHNGKITYSLFHQYQDGWYDTDISLFDPSLSEGELMSRIQLKFNWVGAIYNQSLTLDKLKLSFGLNYNVQNRNHTGLSNYQKGGFSQDYFNTGIKHEYSQYVKGEYSLKKFTLYGDIQFRYVNFKYESESDNITLYEGSHENYSAGLSYKEGNHILHYGFGQTSREPRRSDLFGGTDNYTGTLNKLKDESVFSEDLGYKYVNETIELGVNLYKMSFTNEFMPTGSYGENGITLYKNVKNSYRKGLEINGKIILDQFEVSGNLTLSKNKYETKDTSLPGPLVFMKWNNSILSPASVGNINVKYRYNRLSYVGLSARYNGEAYIDLNNNYTLPSYTALDMYMGVSKGIFDVRLNFNNITNSLILTNGMIGFDGNPRYYVMNSLTSLLTIKIKI